MILMPFWDEGVDVGEYLKKMEEAITFCDRLFFNVLFSRPVFELIPVGQLVIPDDRLQI
jgi:hypothetical protein